MKVRDMIDFLWTLDQDKEIKFIEPGQGDWKESWFVKVEHDGGVYFLIGESDECLHKEIKDYDEEL